MDDIALDDIAADAEEGPDVDEETSFIDPASIGAEQAEGRAGPKIASLQQKLLQSAVDDYYNALEEEGLLPTLGRDVSNF